MGSEQVNLSGAPETMLATLYLRALDNRSDKPILGDAQAEDAVRRIDYDYSKFRMRARQAPSVAIRAKALDRWTEQCLARQPDVTVLHLGCGLDTRVWRIDPPASVRWYDIDFPEVIDLRRKVFPERDGYETVASSVTEPGLLDRIPDDRPVLVVAEGLTMYLSEEDGLGLLRGITGRFPSGELIFDAFNTFGVKLSNRFNPAVVAAKAHLEFAVDDPSDLESAVPGLRLVAEWQFTDAPELDRYAWPTRMLLQAMGRIPVVRRMGRMLHYRFGDASR
ncbi:O-methyltransferase involved in polyketide biosynthesis [Saccharopolyspora erythraea NRRL 2338]|uniref:O-methyltransferase-like protein n=2 Tax=Saccharopolyspora erythraea TaxID=1836 RepID=A4FP67_SACEN|nr:class I SAM-dependent methyltransferase [Saccharopolyspora erythraea]EQD84786.1 O-methyltransferase [Saccharopolyspora erythraea D]PFG99484.1 O-methyltransferase involved in polyketide biosynthesis [Saccharopolyspora erythraea NRRL 2338]QRK89388.1 class I SAM-dependent methyltransferase [Saccharopolyspora erythraea]CAM05842.1 O-methyltransferase-like protein [Saccharopolyspora erythraea NRRL 2338]